MQELSGVNKQYANIIRIDDLVRRETYPSVERLAEVTGVSQRQVLRILKDMKEVYHAPLHYDRSRKGYCYLLDGFSVAGIFLDEDESLALQVCSDLIARVFGGTRLFGRLHQGICSLMRRAELYDREEGRALANRIQLATGTNPMQLALFRRQKDLEDILFGSLKEGRLLNVSFLDNEGQVQWETCLPLMLVMHESLAWLLFHVKASAFSGDFTAVDLGEDSFGILSLSGVTAVAPYRDGHARQVVIANRLTGFPGGAVSSLDKPFATCAPEDTGVRMGLCMGFGLSFPGLVGGGPYQVYLDYVLDEERGEYRLCDAFPLSGVFREDPEGEACGAEGSREAAANPAGGGDRKPSGKSCGGLPDGSCGDGEGDFPRIIF